MKRLSKMVSFLKEKLLGRKSQPPVTKVPRSDKRSKLPPSKPRKKAAPRASNRDPFFIQIGLDFGTSFLKCVYRDVNLDKAWIHKSRGSEGYEFPFLMPSTLILRKGVLEHATDPECHYPENGLYHLKLALKRMALCEWEDPLLQSYRRRLARKAELSRFVESCGIYLLAGVLGEIRKSVRQRFVGFGGNQNDHMAVNMAIPIAYGESRAVSDLFYRILCEAWELADKLAGHPRINLNDLEGQRKPENKFVRDSMDQVCFIYPEVSANVQGFVRSRASSPGIYLFSDAGAGTVDQSVFIFLRGDGKEQLNYLYGSVLPLGSSYIERYALSTPDPSGTLLEQWRKKKERGENEPSLERARNRVAEELYRDTLRTLGAAKQKLFVRDQLNQIRIIFGGGGHCVNPYENGVKRTFFSGPLFNPGVNPDIVGIPNPIDLEGRTKQPSLQRLSVAYGLSFIRDELSFFTYPQENRTPDSQEIWHRKALCHEAPTKDQC